MIGEGIFYEFFVSNFHFSFFHFIIFAEKDFFSDLHQCCDYIPYNFPNRLFYTEKLV